MAKEYIEREAALRELRLRRYFETADVITACDAVCYVPVSDVREVVTCEACVWHVDDGTHYCNKWCEPCPDNAEFFCAYGERREQP